MKTVHPIETETTFFLPADDILAVWPAVSTEETRFYLRGAYIEALDGGPVTAVATDGHVLLRKPCGDGAFVGSAVTTQGDDHARGFILSTDTKDKAWKAKASGAVWVYGDTETGILQFLDTGGFPRVGVCEFDRIDGTFPDWRRVMPKQEPGGSGPAIALDAKKIRQMETAASPFYRGQRTATPLRMTPGESHGDPVLVDFPDRCGGLAGVIMPVRWDIGRTN